MRWTWECTNCGRRSIPLGEGRCVCGKTREEVGEENRMIRQRGLSKLTEEEKRALGLK